LQVTTRRIKRPTVQLTSLLDLLFVMVFLSLLQSKDIPMPVVETTVPEVVVEKTPTPVVEPSPFSLTAIFHFYAVASNPTVESGTFAMAGTYDQQTGELYLGGVNWIQRPTDYDMVPLTGRIFGGEQEFTGRVDFPTCQVFSLRRTSTTGRTPISGVWEGVYTCGQGETGLKLTIQ
jgi:hypothetical protein